MNEVVKKVKQEDVQKVLDLMDDNCEQLCPEDLQELASKMNEKINLPLVNEDLEQRFFRWLISKIDHVAYNSLSRDYYNLLRNSLDGINPREADLIKKIIVDELDRAINFKLIPDSVEEFIIRIAIDFLFKAFYKDHSVEELAKAA